MKTSAILALLVASSLLLSASAAAVNCGDVASKSAPCLGYLTGKSPSPAKPCCGGLQALAKEAVTTATRRAICNCMKKGVKAFPGVQDRYLSQVPQACGINVGFPISLNTNCDSIK